ncbi:MAG: GFA family protein [Rhodopila sp.]
MTGEPAIIAACHCEECQRRTGAPFGVSAYFEKSQAKAEGTYKVYTRDCQEGRKVRIHFCPECGTSVYWDADFLPTHLGIAVGTFFDPSFPAPRLSVWERSRHPWVAFNQDLPGFPQSYVGRSKSAD